VIAGGACRGHLGRAVERHHLTMADGGKHKAGGDAMAAPDLEHTLPGARSEQVGGEAMTVRG